MPNFHVDSSGNMWSGISSTTYSATAPFYVTSAGVLKASAGTFGGITINSGDIQANYSASSKTGFKIDSSGNAYFNSVDVRIGATAGSGTPGTIAGDKRLDLGDSLLFEFGNRLWISSPQIVIWDNDYSASATSPSLNLFGTYAQPGFYVDDSQTLRTKLMYTSGNNVIFHTESDNTYFHLDGSGIKIGTATGGNNQYIGKNSSGTFGWHNLPAASGGVYSSYISINSLSMQSGYNFDIVGSGNISVSTSSNPHKATISTSAAAVGASGGLNGSSSNAARYDHSHDYASSSHGIHMPSGSFTTGTGFLSGSGTVSSSGVISVSGTNTRNATIFTQHHYPTSGSTYNLGTTADGLYWKRLYASQSTYVSSDQRLKTEIIDIPYGLDYINSLSPKQYEIIRRIGKGCNTCDTRLKDDAVECNVCEENGDTADIVNNFDYTGEPIGKKHFGFLAQDLISTPPEPDLDIALVEHDIENDSYVVAHDEFIAPLVKAVQELSTLVSDLTARIEALEG